MKVDHNSNQVDAASTYYLLFLSGSSVTFLPMYKHQGIMRMDMLSGRQPSIDLYYYCFNIHSARAQFIVLIIESD